MKESNEWATQNKVDLAADEVRAERECDVTEVKPYWVAKKLGCEPNGSLCEKVYNWRARREAERDGYTVDVPPQAETEFQATLDRLTTEMMGAFRRVVRSVGSDLDRAAALRVADAERRRDMAESDRADVLTLLRQTEESLSAAQKEIADQRLALRATRLREERLIGRLEQREADAPAEVSPPPEDTGTREDPALPASDATEQPAVETERAPCAQDDMRLPGIGEA